MKKKLTILLLALMLAASALAEAYEGTTAPLSTAVVTAGASGIVQALDAEVGSHVNAGDVMASMKPERAFAARDGSVSLVNAGEGDKIDGTLCTGCGVCARLCKFDAFAGKEEKA